MKSTVDKFPKLKRKLTIEIPVETVRIAFNETYKDMQKTTTIKGFRKGKAPIAQIKTLYGGQVKQDVLEKLLNNSYPIALAEHSLQPVIDPTLNFEKLNDNENFSYTAEFEVRPEIIFNKYKNLKVEKEKLEFDDSKVNKVLDHLRQAHAEYTPTFEDHPARDGDTVKIDLKGFTEDGLLSGVEAQDYQLELGSRSFIPGFESGIEGMKINENRTLSLSFPEDYHATEIAGKLVNFEITLKAIEKKSLPELNDEFVKKIGPLDTLDALKEGIKEYLIKNEEQRIQQDLEDRVVDELINENPIEVPQSLVTQQKKHVIADIKKELMEQGVSEEQCKEYEEEWNDDFTQSAEDIVKAIFLISHLAHELKLHSTEEDINAKIKEQAQSMNMKVTQMEDHYEVDDRRSNLGFMITEDKVVQYLIEKADVKEVAKNELKDDV